jgi:hypothetical protein
MNEYFFNFALRAVPVSLDELTLPVKVFLNAELRGRYMCAELPSVELRWLSSLDLRI